jgi:hypothetical protein
MLPVDGPEQIAFWLLLVAHLLEGGVYCAFSVIDCIIVRLFYMWRNYWFNLQSWGLIYRAEGMGLSSIFKVGVSAVVFAYQNGIQRVNCLIMLCSNILWVIVFIVPHSVKFYKFTDWNLRLYFLLWNDHFDYFVFEVAKTKRQNKYRYKNHKKA